MAIVKTLPLDLRAGDRLVAGPQGRTRQPRTVRTRVEVVAPMRCIEVEWVESDQTSRFDLSNRLYISRR